MSQPLQDVPLGTRVVVRYLIEGGQRATDILGPLVDRTDTALTVDGKRAPVTIPIVDVVAAKRVPPPPHRRNVRR
ncbi:MAG: hypothetical protein WBA72_05085 [Ornithinimicrobium sp.]